VVVTKFAYIIVLHTSIGLIIHIDGFTDGYLQIPPLV
jgi:hypothetical protein